jgi:CBS domain-containing protein
VGSIGPGAPFDSALAQLRASGLPALPVVDETRRVVGLITTDNIADLILVRRHLPARP